VPSARAGALQHAARARAALWTLAALALVIFACAGARASAFASAGDRHAARARDAAQAAPARPAASAALEGCQGAVSESARSATFAGEMTAVPGTARMQISILVIERLPGEGAYHQVNAPGLDVWRSSTPGVQSYRYVRQVTNLAAPALYRAAVRFRWLGARGKVIQALELHTRRCELTAATLGTR